MDFFNQKLFRPYVSVDVESDGRAPGIFSMTAFAAVVVAPGLNTTFNSYLRPLSDASYDAAALAVSGMTHEMTITEDKFRDPFVVMLEFYRWLKIYTNNPVFISENVGFDWMFIEWYFAKFLPQESNPFGYSGSDCGNIFNGMVDDANLKYEHLPLTKNTHNPLDDAKRKAELVLYLMMKKGFTPKTQKRF